MDVRCIEAFGMTVPGDVVAGLPDGAAVDPRYWEVIEPADQGPPPAAPAAGALSPASAVSPAAAGEGA